MYGLSASPALRGNGKKNIWFQTKSCRVLEHSLLLHPVLSHPLQYYCIAGVCSHSLAVINTVSSPCRCHTPRNLAEGCSHSLAVINTVNTPPRYDALPITPPLAAGVPWSVLIARDTLDIYSTHTLTTPNPGTIFLKVKLLSPV